jgi:hypothetical protein
MHLSVVLAQAATHARVAPSHVSLLMHAFSKSHAPRFFFTLPCRPWERVFTVLVETP